MKITDLVNQLGLTVFTGDVGLDNEIKGGYVSDLLSDVMGFASEGDIWITLQNHLNVVAIASLKDLACIILVKNINPSNEVLLKAKEEGIPILGTKENTFEMAGKIYKIIK